MKISVEIVTASRCDNGRYYPIQQSRPRRDELWSKDAVIDKASCSRQFTLEGKSNHHK